MNNVFVVYASVLLVFVCSFYLYNFLVLSFVIIRYFYSSVKVSLL